MEGLSFECANHKRSRKSFADSCTERQIEIAAATLLDFPQALQFFSVCSPKLIARKPPRVVHTTQDYQSAYLEMARKPRKRTL